MSLIRALASASRPAARRLMSTATGAPGYCLTGSHHRLALSRAFATEPGFLDSGGVSERVLEVVRKFEKVTPGLVGPTSHFVNDLGLDSLDTVELVMAIEDEFAIEIPDRDAEGILTVEDAVKYISSNVNAK